MGKLKTSNKIIEEIVQLRSLGYSISEIVNSVGKSKSVVSKYIKNVLISPKYYEILKKKQGASKYRSDILWDNSKLSAKNIVKKLDSREKIILLAGIYWGEGTKRELNIINGDPILLKAFVIFIKEIGVSKDRIKASIRIYDTINYQEALSYWSDLLGIDKNRFFTVEVVKGSNKSKFKFGMCRLRVEKSSKEFKLLMSIIEVLKEQIMLS